MNCETWVDEYGDYLFRYAVIRLRNRGEAEDAVQETFLAALKSMDKFSGKSDIRTWLTGILKHKIVDHIRKQSRILLGEGDPFQEDCNHDWFDKRGHWRRRPAEWIKNPEEVLENAEFWKVFSRCLSLLPKQMFNIFSLRELEEMPGADVCKVMDISATNLWVILHRARSRLRQCLEVNWLESKQA